LSDNVAQASGIEAATDMGKGCAATGARRYRTNG